MPETNKNLWAPWRMEYIRSMSEVPASSGCFLCTYWNDPASDEANRVVARRETCFAVMNRFPYSNGHLLVACGRHCGRLEELSEAEILEMNLLTRDLVTFLERAVQAQGFNVGMNLGHVAGAGLPDHLHIHIVPRWGGDTNYMAVVSDVRVINESIVAVYQTLRRMIG